MRRARGTVVALLTIAVGLAVAASAEAAFPGANGRILFSDTSTAAGLVVTDAGGAGPQEILPEEQSQGQADVDYAPGGSKFVFTGGDGLDTNNDLYLANSDGSGVTLVKDAAEDTFYAAFSADGQKIFYTEDDPDNVSGSIWSVNPDGSGAQLVYNVPAFETAPSNLQASPDGTKLVFDLNCEIWEVGVDGSNPTALTDNVEDCDDHPDYSPSGSMIVYSSRDLGASPILKTVPSGGGAVTHLTADDDLWEGVPAYSPDGTKIVYLETDVGAGGETALATIDAGGGNRAVLLEGHSGIADWGSDTTPVSGGPGPNPPDGGGGGGGGGDGEVNADLDAKKKQRSSKAIKLKVTCEKACDATVSGSAKVQGGKKKRTAAAAKAKQIKLKGQTKSIAAGETAALKLKPKGKKNKKKLKKAVKRGKKVKVPLKVRIEEAEGDSTVLKQTVILKKKKQR